MTGWLGVGRGARRTSIAALAGAGIGVMAHGWSSGEAKGVSSGEGSPSTRVLVPSKPRLMDLMCAYLDTVARVHSKVGGRRADCERDADAAVKLADESNRAMDIHWSIPEFHDEQRLRDGLGTPDTVGNTTFGPTAYFYAMPQIATYKTINQIDAQGPRGTLVGIVVVDNDGPIPDSYRRLHLEYGLNCVWLSHRPGTTEWRGAVTKAETTHECVRSHTAPPGDLAVFRTTGGSIHDYPPVVRFSEGTWRSGGQVYVQPLLGVKCLDGWCRIGPQRFEPEGPLPAEARDLLVQNGVRESIKGWYDDQWLATRVGNELRPTVRAMLVPRPKIDEHSLNQLTQTPVPIAHLFLFDDPPTGSKYARWGLHKGSNKLYLSGSGNDFTMSVGTPSAAQGPTWITVRTPHHDEAIPGTARFRWLMHDEGIWIPCDQACCQANADE